MISSQEWLSKPRKVIGIMTGTSVDGIDCCLNEFYIKDDKHHQTLLNYKVFDFSESMRTEILRIMNENIHISELSRLSFKIASLYSECIKEFLMINHINIDKIDAIGIHGQTLWHEVNIYDNIKNYNTNANKNEFIANTLQCCSGTALAAMIGKPVVYDFRSSDIALGGQGAPLVPIFDYNFLLNTDCDCAALNIGGISNVTYLPKDRDENKVIAFDTGPGNVLLDLTAKKYFGINYDKDGKLARQGAVITKVFEEIINLNYFTQNPPKSTGRELFNQLFIDKYFGINDYYSPNDLLTTLTEYTAWSISFNIKEYLPPIKKIYISGGGAENKFLIERLNYYLNIIEVIKTDEIGIPSDAKEAMCFAYLAWLTLGALPGNIPSVTGASKKAVLGAVAF